MIDIYDISQPGLITLAVFWYLVSVCILCVVFRSMFRSTLKSYTDALHEQYVKALEEYKRQHRV